MELEYKNANEVCFKQVFARCSSKEANCEDADVDIMYDIVRPERFEDVMCHMRNNFFADEPLNKHLNLVARGERHEELEEYILRSLRQGVSLMALDLSTSEVIGVLINGYTTDDCEEQEPPLEIKDPKFKKIADFLSKVHEDIELVSQYKPGELFDLKMLSIDQKFWGKGYGEKLFLESEKLAQSEDYKAMISSVSASASQKILEKLGYKTIKEVVYAEYPTKESPIFKPEPPDVSFKFMYKKIENC